MIDWQWREESPPVPSCIGGITFVAGIALIAVVISFGLWVLATEVLALWG
jgi:hypothetical protein